MVFFISLRNGKRTSNIWDRAIIEAIQAGATVDKVYIQKEASGELMKDLMKVMKEKTLISLTCLLRN